MESHPSSTDSWRLPKRVVPLHYDLHYECIDLKRFRFSGAVSIVIGVSSESIDCVVLHAVELGLTRATLSRCRSKKGDVGDSEGIGEAEPETTVEALEFVYSKKQQTCRILFPDGVEAGGAPLVLKIEFAGTLNDSMRGLYRSSYTAIDGSRRTMATTQFEPTDARRAFPCFDEPALKATFALSVTLDDVTLTAISNMPILSQHSAFDPQKRRVVKTVTYQRTPRMSTYLVALIVGEFDVIAATSLETDVRTSVYTLPGKASQGHFCLDVASKCLDLYANLFDVPYPLSKSDLVAIPDFAAGAMENWGCVTYREAKILVKEGSTSESFRRGIARTVCHELAHQWFGNLVTMEYWTQLWLNEGFARFMEFVAIDSMFPEWDAWTEFVQSVYGLALGLDAMESSHPIEVEVRHPDEISEIFDAISYAKGASVIRMLSSYIGFDIFLKGIKTYLNRHAYGNSTTDDLWEALAEASGLPIVNLMSPWTSQMGFPLIRLPEESDGVIECPRFLSSGPKHSEFDKSESSAWPVPVTALVEGESDLQGPWIINGPAGDDSSALLENINRWTMDGKWFKLNASQVGFYRVAYTSQQWDRLSDVLTPRGPLPAADRLGLISDSFAAGRAGYSSIVESLKLVKKFGSHDIAEYAVWQELSENLAGMSSLYRAASFFPAFQAFIRSIYSKQMEMIGWDASEGEPQRAGTLRSTIISMLGTANDQNVRSEALNRFRRFANNPLGSPIPGDLKNVIFRIALLQDEAYAYSELKQIYENSTFPEEQRGCLSVLGRVRDMKRHSEMIEFTLFSGKVRLQDIAFSLSSLSSTTDDGGKACWEYMKTQFHTLKSMYMDGPMWGACIGIFTGGLRTLDEANDVEKFFDDPSHPCGSGKRRLAQGLEAIRTRAANLERDCVVLEEYFKNDTA